MHNKKDGGKGGLEGTIWKCQEGDWVYQRV